MRRWPEGILIPLTSEPGEVTRVLDEAERLDNTRKLYIALTRAGQQVVGAPSRTVPEGSGRDRIK